MAEAKRNTRRRLALSDRDLDAPEPEVVVLVRDLAAANPVEERVIAERARRQASMRVPLSSRERAVRALSHSPNRSSRATRSSGRQRTKRAAASCGATA